MKYSKKMDAKSRNWLAKELSDISNVSVHTLHYYDKIGLLKPSLRRNNGYRVYVEKDLIRLQQIVTLRYLGLDLKQISLVVDQKLNLIDQLLQQRIVLKNKEESFAILRKSIEGALRQIDPLTNKLSLQEIINLIRSFSVKNNYDGSWMKDVFSEKHLELMNQEYETLKDIPETEWIRYGKDWEGLIEDVELHLKDDPQSKIGKFYGQKWLNLAYKYWKNEETGRARWEAIKNNKIPSDAFGWPRLNNEVIKWIETAIATHKITPNK